MWDGFRYGSASTEDEQDTSVEGKGGRGWKDGENESNVEKLG